MGKILNSSGDFDDIAEPLKLIHFNELDPECGKKSYLIHFDLKKDDGNCKVINYKEQIN